MEMYNPCHPGEIIREEYLKPLKITVTEAALKLGELIQGVVILGSATPSLESFYRALKKEFHLLELTKRVPSSRVPQLYLADRRTHSKNLAIFSPELLQAISKAILRREQVILALNRRGFSTFLLWVSILE